MNLQFFKTFYQNNIKYGFVSGINMLGLVLGLLSTMLILEYVLFERSYEDYNENAPNVYRVAYNRYQEGELQWKTANSFFPTGYFMKDHFGEVEEFTVISRNYNITVSYNDRSGNKVFYNEEKTYYSTSSIFRLFSIDVIAGDENCLDEPGTVAISEHAARKYFGDENPLGESIWVNYTQNFTVKAIYKTLPQNTHLKSDFFFSMQTVLAGNPGMANDWNFDYYHTYLMLAPGTDYKEFAAKAFPVMIEQNYQQMLTAMSLRDEFYLQPIQDIHLRSNIEYETEKPVNGKMVTVLFGFSIFFLIVAWINYINMITALAVERAREIGVKKVNGAKRKRLIVQFIAEAILLNTVCMVIALVVYLLVNPYFVSYTVIQPFFISHHPVFMVIAGMIFITGILLSSIYPAMVLSSYEPVSVLKGMFKHSPRGMLLRKILVTFQFLISLVLLIATLASFRQIRYIDKKDIGIDYSSTMVIRAPKNGADTTGLYSNKLLLFKNRIKQMPEVERFTFSSDVPGREINHWYGGKRRGFTNDDIKAYFHIMMDADFIDFYGVRLLAGRGFAENESSDQNNILMNLSAMKRFGYDTPEEGVNKIMDSFGRELEVVGITEDFNYYSKKIEPVPTIMTLEDQGKEFLAVKMGSGVSDDYRSFIEEIGLLYEEIFPERPFEYFFLEDEMEWDLKPDKTFLSIFGTFSVLAILISVIGITGLIVVTINQNMKTLAVRKALGAGIRQIILIISKQLVWPFIISIAIAVPFSYYGLKNWILINYIHRIELNYSIFLMPVLLIIGIVTAILFLLSLKVRKIEIAQVLQYE